MTSYTNCRPHFLPLTPLLPLPRTRNFCSCVTVSVACAGDKAIPVSTRRILLLSDPISVYHIAAVKMATTTQFISGLAAGVLLSLLLLVLPYLLPAATTSSSSNFHASLLTTLVTSPYLSFALLLPALLLVLTVQYHLFSPYSLTLTLPYTTKSRHSKRNLSNLPPPYPSTYYRLLASSHLPPSAVLPASLNQSHDLVVYRPAKGEVNSRPVVLDAYCPHLGAHLAYGGKVVGDCIDCPFHGWRFNRDGKCTVIPYANKVPEVARTNVWPVLEVDNSIMVWYDADNNPPPPNHSNQLYSATGGGSGGRGGRCVGWLSTEVGGHVREVMEAFIDRASVDVDNVYGLLHVRWQRLTQWRESGGEGRIDVQLTVSAVGRQLYAVTGELHVVSPVYACLLLRSHSSSPPSHFLFLSLLPSAPFVHTLTAALHTTATYNPIRVLLSRLLLLHPLLAVVQQQMTMASAKGETSSGSSSSSGSSGSDRLHSEVDGALLAYRRWYDTFCSGKGTKRRDGLDW